MKAIKKLHEARKILRETPVKKLGRNAYSNYDYFTPSQIMGMVERVNQKLGLFTKFDLVRTELGLMAGLSIYDIESGDKVSFETATEIPSIKATNLAQQIGGTITYSQRYLLTTAYAIAEDELDFDSQDNRPAKSSDKFITEDQIRQLTVLLSKTAKTQEEKDAIEVTFPSLKQSQFKNAVARLEMDARAPGESENLSQKEINQMLDNK